MYINLICMILRKDDWSMVNSTIQTAMQYALDQHDPCLSSTTSDDQFCKKINYFCIPYFNTISEKYGQIHRMATLSL